MIDQERKHRPMKNNTNKKAKRMRLLVRIFTLFMVAAMLAGTFYYAIVFLFL